MRYSIKCGPGADAKESVDGVMTADVSVTGASVKFAALFPLFYNVSVVVAELSGPVYEVTLNFDCDFTIQSVSSGTLTTIEADGYEVYNQFQAASTITQFLAGRVYLVPAKYIPNIKVSLHTTPAVGTTPSGVGSDSNLTNCIIGDDFVQFFCMTNTNLIGVTSLSGVVNVGFNRPAFLQKVQNENEKKEIRGQNFAQIFLNQN